MNKKQSYFRIEIENVKLGYVISYIYARMLASSKEIESFWSKTEYKPCSWHSCTGSVCMSR